MYNQFTGKDIYTGFLGMQDTAQVFGKDWFWNKPSPEEMTLGWKMFENAESSSSN